MSDRLTFSDLGISFPLFTAPVHEAAEYRELGTCELCQALNAYCFSATNLEGRSRIACYSCLRNGQVGIRKNTVVGLVVPRSAEEGITDAVGHSVEELATYGFEILPHPTEPDDPDWHCVRVSKEHLLELLRTPSFLNWQGCCWLFCCKRPMVYVGIWKEPEFEFHAGPNDPAEFFNQIMVNLPPEQVAWGRHAPLSQCGGPYVFRCSVCGGYKRNLDMP